MFCTNTAYCHATQPLLLELLQETGIDLSEGQLNRLLIGQKDRTLATGLQVSRYINSDDTGARHQSKIGYCTYIGNELFCFFESAQSKSRINFLNKHYNQDNFCSALAKLSHP